MRQLLLLELHSHLGLGKLAPSLHDDVGISSWPDLRDGPWLHAILGSRRQERYWRHLFDKVAAGRIHTWDYQWTFACWTARAMSAVPNVNLVSNIGFGEGSSHTRLRSAFADVPTEAMAFPLRHPSLITADAAADAFTAREVYRPTIPRLLIKARRDPTGFLRQARGEARKRLRDALAR